MTFVEPFAALEATGQNFYNQLSPEDKAYYKSIQHNGKNLTREQIENLLANKAMLRAKNEAKESIIKTLGSEGTTLEYMKSGDRGFITQAIGGVLESLPAMATGMAGKAVGFTGLALQAYSGIEEEMLSDPDFQYTSAGDRAIIAIPYAAGMGVLENVGLQNLVKGDSFLGKVMMDVAIKSAKKVGANATKEALERVAAKEVESLLAKGLIRVTQAGVAEFETGFTQALVLDQGLKQAYNWIQQSGMTEEQRKNLTQGEYFDTADSLKELGSKTFEDGVAEMIGGFTMGSVGTVLQAVVNGNISLYNEDDVKFLKDVVADSNFKKLYVASMKTQMLDGKITKSKAQQNLDNLNEIEAAFDMMPDGLSTADMNKSLSLITERAQLTREKAGKDPNLVAPLEARIKTINEELTKIGENAVQEQATSKVPLQPGAESGGEVAQGKPEAGSQEVTQEGSQAQEVEQGKFVAEEATRLAQENISTEQRQSLVDRLYEDPIAYARENNTPGSPSERFLNSLEQQPVTQEAGVAEEQAQKLELNIVNNENINDVIERQDTETKQKIAKSAKLAMKAIPKAKIYLHNDTTEYNRAVGEETYGTEKGSFIASDGAIHINMQEAFPHTLLHEAFHYVILNKGLDAVKLNGWVKGLRSIVKDKKLLNRLDNLLENYSAEEQSEEFISELGSIMGAAKGQLSTNALQKFKTLINKIAKSLGLPTIFTAASTKQDAVDFINTISKQLVIGEEIELNEPGTGGEIGTFNVPKRKLQKAIRVSEDPRDFIRKL